MTESSQPSRGMRILQTVLYILAGIVLVPGLVTGVSLLISTKMIVSNLLLPVQLLGSQPIYNLIAPMVTGLLINIGIIVIVLAIIFSALLYAVARLVGHILHLETRLARLEGGAVREPPYRDRQPLQP